MSLKTVLLPPSPELIHAMRKEDKAVQNMLFSFRIHHISNMGIPSSLNIHLHCSVRFQLENLTIVTPQVRVQLNKPVVLEILPCIRKHG